jgi:hypothetical protein
MFINCPYCKALVATDPATDLPPEQCPRCAANLREAPAEAATPAVPTAQGNDERAIDPALLLEVPTQIEPPPSTGAPAAVELQLSSQIHRIVAGATAAEASPFAGPGITPISVLLKPKADVAAPAPEAPTAAEPVPTGPATAAPAARSPASTPASMPASTPASVPAPAEAGNAVAAMPAPAVPVQGVPMQAAPEPAPIPTPESGSTGATTTAMPPQGPRIATAMPEPATEPAPAAASAPGAKPLPSFAHRVTGTASRSGFDWKISSAVAALVLLLLLQLLLADRVQLAADARWRPLVSGLCRVSGCTLPPWREPAAFAVLARDVRPHPSAPGTLRVTATFRNDARWPQPWPQLRLTLSDVDGNAVASRDFTARDYLGATPSPAELASGQSASIAMDIVEPAARSVAFDFQLH